MKIRDFSFTLFRQSCMSDAKYIDFSALKYPADKVSRFT